MSFLDKVIENLPEVRPPTQKKQSFKQKLRWTGIVLALYFLLTLIPLYGLESNALEQFQFLSTILGASFGSLISLGIGPIVTASIVLQLLNGSGLINFDLTSEIGKKRFQGLQKILAVSFTIIESFIFVYLGGFTAAPGMSPMVLVVQLAIGGLFIILMDEIVTKYGFGSGVSLFIAAGVSQEIFIQLFNPFASEFSGGIPVGAIPAIIQSIVSGSPEGLQTASILGARVLATVAVFFTVVYVQAMKVEIPLSFGRVKGHGVRWPLNFLYANVIPIILVAALLANLQLLARLFENWGYPILGTFSDAAPTSGFVFWVSPPELLTAIVVGSVTITMILQGLAYIALFTLGATVFSIFWVQTAGLDAASQSKQMVSSGLQVPGFRRDKRVLERLLHRYIWPLTIMGGIAIGLLASIADLTGAIGTGTGLLLTVMIIYKLYEDIAKQHMYDMNPMLKKFMGN
jgi:preprotein translocase subunit SecY